MEPLFHITSRSAWVEAVKRGQYAAPSLATEGFIHCSTGPQLLETGKRYFGGQSGLVLLCIRADRLSSPFVFEAAAPLDGGKPRSGSFPHVYGPIDVHALWRVVDFDATGELALPSGLDGPASFPAGPVADNLVLKDERVERFWRNFRARSQVSETTPYQAWHFGDDADLAHELAELLVRGPKRASTTLLWSVEQHPPLAPVPGAYSVVTEHDATPRAVIRTTRIDVCAFDAVEAAFAWEEGEGERTLAAWRADHEEYFSRECERLGRTFTPDAPVVLERFELVEPG
jgi:uncharacterized protein YhfF/uncharacterized protein (DUF952 family)